MSKTNHHDKLPEGTEIIHLTILTDIEKQVVQMHREKLVGINQHFQELMDTLKKTLAPIFQAQMNIATAALSAYSTSLMEQRGISPEDYILNADKLLFEPKPKKEEPKAEQHQKEAAPTV